MSTPGTGSGTSGSVTDTTKNTAKDEAAEVGQSARGAAKHVAQTSSDQASQVASEAKDQARHLTGQVQSQVSEQAGEQQNKLASALHDLGQELREMAEKGGQSGMATDLAHQASQRCEHLAGYLEQHEPGDVLDDVRGYARRKPGTFLLGAAVAGVVLGRLTRGATSKSSSDGQHSRSSRDYVPRRPSEYGERYDTPYGDPTLVAADTPLPPAEPTSPGTGVTGSGDTIETSGAYQPGRSQS